MAQALIHFDTSLLIRAINRNSGEDRQLRRWPQQRVPLGISTIGWTEFMCGPLDQRQLAQAAAIVGEPEPFTGQDAICAADLFNRSGRHRGSLMDCIIAAIAIRVGASIATANRADFRRFPNLHME
jgi:predicted nucleic acid-binding protein